MQTPDTQTVHISTLSGIPDGTMLQTDEGMPNIVVRTRPWWLRTLIRICRMYGVAFGGMLSLVLGNPSPEYLQPPQEFVGKVILAAGFALAPAATQLFYNAIEWLVREDAR